MSNPITIIYNGVRNHPYYFLLTLLISTASFVLIYFFLIKPQEDKPNPNR